MKTKIFYCMLLLFSINFLACSDGEDGMDGLDGEQGPQGEQGPMGPQGIEGNANVTQYTFGEHDFSVSSSVNLDIPDVTEEEIKQSSWHVYMVRPGGNVYPIPGWGVDGMTEYRIYMLHVPANNGSARITITIKNGTGEIYAELIVIRVIANNTEDLSSKEAELPNIDFRDYEAVRSYYGLND
ncbi:hypothetical protein OOZ15_03600 [Galbibacter sp. EGI 63066]|uniref:hypothetical protein n=1 Tax=Galbibacter sp. EGI 63066 TaxID=2993559 RepID=UPI0022498792|nr:hypothetical protein [Galbibacter sp. EGI 63066]MCX2679016.1 hypothetical protein [Galbibacter sp. EGI 63066]